MASLDDLLAEVDAWFAEELQRAPVSQITEMYNQVHAAWQSLRNRLSVAVTGQPLAPPEPQVEEPALPEGGEGPTTGEGAAEELGSGEGPSEEPGKPDGASKTSKSKAGN